MIRMRMEHTDETQAKTFSFQLCLEIVLGVDQETVVPRTLFTSIG